jgi:hypothetical protein
LHPSKVSISADPVQKQKMLAVVLANGCLATLAIIGLFVRDGSTGRAGDDWALYTASQLHAFEYELGVQDPGGFWGPAVSLPMDVDRVKLDGVPVRGHNGLEGRLWLQGLPAPVRGHGGLEGDFGFKVYPPWIGQSRRTTASRRWPSSACPARTVRLAVLGIMAFRERAGACRARLASGIRLVSRLMERGELRSPSPGRSQARRLCAPGILGLHPSKVSISVNPAQKQKMLAVGLANGWMTVIGMFFRDGSSGRAGGDWARRRQTEFKHGRIAQLLACMDSRVGLYMISEKSGGLSLLVCS